MRRAMVNVMDNAVDALKESEIKKKILSINTSSTKESLTIEIKDNGIGIPEDIMEKIFEPLFSTKGFGVGLGMPIVQNIIRDHRGSLEVNNNKDHGVSVIFKIPLTNKLETIS